MEEFTELIKKFKIDVKRFEDEQKKLAKLVIEKDYMDFSEVRLVAGCDTSTIGKEVIGSIVVLSEDFEVIEEKFSLKRATFPYIPSFLAYRELPVLIDAFHKLENKPDVFFINGHGTLHPRGCGLASHFGIAVDAATIGIAKELLVGEVKDSKIFLNGKQKGYALITKEGSKPIYISVGNKVKLSSAVELTKKFIKQPHKLPEPLTLAHKYANKIKEELVR